MRRQVAYLGVVPCITCLVRLGGAVQLLQPSSTESTTGSPEELYDNPTKYIRSNYEKDIGRGTIPVFAFDRGAHDQMQRMAIGWVNVKDGSPRARVAFSTMMNPETIREAFKVVRMKKPKVVLWLFPFKDGDRSNILPMLERNFKETSRYTRHGVFHWPPEVCDHRGATLENTLKAYEHVDFVFQFGYQDERLASSDPNKFMPWPLGAAWFKGWDDPESPPQMSKRKHLAVFRGAGNTHNIGSLQEAVKGMKDVIIEDSGKWVRQDNASSSSRYKELLSTSKFSINLPGHSPNCYRLFESVVSGSVPIIFLPKNRNDCHKNWAAVYGHPTDTKYVWIPKAPFEVLKKLGDLPKKLQMLSKAAINDKRSSELNNWYNMWRKAFHDKLIEKLAASKKAN